MPVKLINNPNNFLAAPTPLQEIKEMVQAYKYGMCKESTIQLRALYPDRKNIAEAESAWVSRKEIESLLNDNKASGIRIYFGCHTKSTADAATGTLEYEGLHNVILVATVDSVDDGNPKPENSINQLKEGATADKADSVVYTSMGLDSIPLCPPNCPGINGNL